MINLFLWTKNLQKVLIETKMKKIQEEIQVLYLKHQVKKIYLEINLIVKIKQIHQIQLKINSEEKNINKKLMVKTVLNMNLKVLMNLIMKLIVLLLYQNKKKKNQ